MLIWIEKTEHYELVEPTPIPAEAQPDWLAGILADADAHPSQLRMPQCDFEAIDLELQ